MIHPWTQFYFVSSKFGTYSIRD